MNPTHSPYLETTSTGTPSVSLEPDPALAGGDPVNPLAAQMLPEQVCRHFRMLPVSYDGATLIVAMADPADEMARDVALALTSEEIDVVLAPPSQIDAAIERVFGDLGHYPGFDAEAPSFGPPEPGSVVAPGRIGEILVGRGLITEVRRVPERGQSPIERIGG